MWPCVRFGEFLRGFGPGIAAAVTRMQQAVQESFFHGFLSYEETKQVENYLGLLVDFFQSLCAYLTSAQNRQASLCWLLKEHPVSFSVD